MSMVNLNTKPVTPASRSTDGRGQRDFLRCVGADQILIENAECFARIDLDLSDFEKERTQYYCCNALQVSINNGLTNTPDDYELCVRAENVELPQSGYFGMSAATGALAGMLQFNAKR